MIQARWSSWHGWRNPSPSAPPASTTHAVQCLTGLVFPLSELVNLCQYRCDNPSPQCSKHTCPFHTLLTTMQPRLKKIWHMRVSWGFFFCHVTLWVEPVLMKFFSRMLSSAGSNSSSTSSIKRGRPRDKLSSRWFLKYLWFSEVIWDQNMID